MAVELRCPECKSKLRLREDPDLDSEIECGQCGHLFPCGENIVRAGDADDVEEKPKKKKSTSDEDDAKPKKKAEGEVTDEKKVDKKPDSKQFKRKKRKGKKRKTKPAILITIIVGAVVAIGSVAGVLIWFFTKKSASQEMMTYLPDDCSIVVGLNLGHMQKYPEFYKSVQQACARTGFKAAGDTFAKALGKESIDDVIDYVVQGAGLAGATRYDATVMRTKVEYDTGLLSKIPGAKEYSLSGTKYYTIPDITELGYPGLRVFAPTPRLVVFCSGATIPEAKFKAMLSGNKDNLEATAFVRSGPLGKQVTRGTVWQFFITDRPSVSITNNNRPLPAGDEDKDMWKEIGQVMAGVKASGYKASVGSRETRGEWFVCYKDSESATNTLKQWKEKEWIKDEEKDPPRWFKSMADRSGIGKTAVNVIRDGLGFKASGELFSIRTSAETKLMQNSLGSIVGTFIGQSQSMGGPGGMGGGLPGPAGVPGPGGPPGGMPGPGGGPPKKRRARYVCRRRLPTVIRS